MFLVTKPVSLSTFTMPSTGHHNTGTQRRRRCVQEKGEGREGGEVKPLTKINRPHRSVLKLGGYGSEAFILDQSPDSQ